MMEKKFYDMLSLLKSLHCPTANLSPHKTQRRSMVTKKKTGSPTLTQDTDHVTLTQSIGLYLLKGKKNTHTHTHLATPPYLSADLTIQLIEAQFDH